MVLKGAAGLLPDFIDAAKDLVRLGAEAITTNCGFLSLFQKEIAGRGRRAGRDLVADAGAVGAGDAAARQARRPRHGVGLDADAGRISQAPACRSIRRWSAPRTAGSFSAC